MSFTYSGDPSKSDIDKYRFAVGDTDSSEPVMTNEEITYIVSTYGPDETAILYHLFMQAAVVFGRAIRRSLGPQSEDPSGRLNFFNDKAEEYKKKLYASGLSVPTYAHKKIFNIGMQSNPPNVLTEDESV